MGRERDGFRENMALLNSMFPDKAMLSASEVSEFTGLSLSTVRRKIRFNPTTKRVTKADLARQVSA